MDLGTIFLAIAIGGALWCAWMIVSESPPNGYLIDAVAVCLDWKPPKGIHAEICVCRCGEIRVALMGDGDDFEPCGLMSVYVNPRDSRVVIHDKLDDASDEFFDTDDEWNQEAFERIINRNWEAN